MATAAMTPVRSESERKKVRDKTKVLLANSRAKAGQCSTVGRDMAKNRDRQRELRVLAQEAIITHGDSSAFDEERRRIEDVLAHQEKVWQQLSRAQSEVASLESELRGELGSPELKAELFVARRSVLWAERRLTEARRDIDGAGEDSGELVRLAAELAHSESLVTEAAADVDRLKKEILDE